MHGAQRQVGPVAEVLHRSGEASAATTTSAENAAAAAQAADEARRVAAEGSEAVRQATLAMAAVREASEHAIRSLGERSAQIGGVVDTIAGIPSRPTSWRSLTQAPA